MTEIEMWKWLIRHSANKIRRLKIKWGKEPPEIPAAEMRIAMEVREIARENLKRLKEK